MCFDTRLAALLLPCVLAAALSGAAAARSVAVPAAAATAVLLCNRAAAQHAQELRLDALMDCGRALVLCPAHVKSLSRRAALFVELRLPAEAVGDLDALLALPGVAQTDVGQQAQQRRREAQAQAASFSSARSQTPLDAYRVLARAQTSLPAALRSRIARRYTALTVLSPRRADPPHLPLPRFRPLDRAWRPPRRGRT